MSPLAFLCVLVNEMCSVAGQLFFKHAMSQPEDAPRGKFFAIFLSGIVAVTRSRTSSSTAPLVIGEYVHPGQTQFTRARGAMRTTSFFRLSINPYATADLAAA